MSTEPSPELLRLLPRLARLSVPERITRLQAIQRLVQKELARLWGERNDEPGHALREDGER